MPLRSMMATEAPGGKAKCASSCPSHARLSERCTTPVTTPSLLRTGWAIWMVGSLDPAYRVVADGEAPGLQGAAEIGAVGGVEAAIEWLGRTNQVPVESEDA